MLGWTPISLACFFHHWLHQSLQPLQCFIGLGASGQRQFVEELCPLLLTLIRLLLCLANPLTMLLDECHHLLARHSDGCRHMHIAVLYDAHRQTARPPVCYLYRQCLAYFASMLILGMRPSFIRWNSRKAVVRRKPLPPEGMPS